MGRKPANHKQKVHSFSLRLVGIDDIDERLENAIYGGGISDALLRLSGGRVYLDFDREGETLCSAVSRAIRDIEHCGDWLRVDALEAEELTSDAFASDHQLAGT